MPLLFEVVKLSETFVYTVISSNAAHVTLTSDTHMHAPGQGRLYYSDQY